MTTPVSVRSWDPSLSAGRAQGDAEDQWWVGGVLLWFAPAEHKKGEAAKENPFKVLSIAT